MATECPGRSAAGETTSSTKEFQEPQSGHLPSHLGDWYPQFWQPKTVLILTIWNNKNNFS
jgi:hypothetical protein